MHVDGGGEATRIVDVTAHIAGATSDPAELHEPYPPMCEVPEGGPDCVANPRDAGFDATQDTRFVDASAGDAFFNATQDTGVVDANPGTPSSDKSSDAPSSDANPSHPEPSLESHDVGSDGCAMGGPVGNHAGAWIMALALSMRRLRRWRRADVQRGAGPVRSLGPKVPLSRLREVRDPLVSLPRTRSFECPSCGPRRVRWSSPARSRLAHRLLSKPIAEHRSRRLDASTCSRDLAKEHP